MTFHGGKALYLGTHAGTLRSAGSMGGTSHLVGGSLTSGLAGGNGSLAGATNFQAVMKNASVHSRTAQNQDSVRFGTQDLRIAIPVAKSATPSPSPTNCGSGNLKSAREEINKSDRNKPSSPGGVLRASSTHSILKVRQPASQVSFDTEQSNKRRSVS